MQTSRDNQNTSKTIHILEILMMIFPFQRNHLNEISRSALIIVTVRWIVKKSLLKRTGNRYLTKKSRRKRKLFWIVWKKNINWSMLLYSTNYWFFSLRRSNESNDDMDKIIQNYVHQEPLSETLQVQYSFFSYHLIIR